MPVTLAQRFRQRVHQQLSEQGLHFVLLSALRLPAGELTTPAAVAKQPVVWVGSCARRVPVLVFSAAPVLRLSDPLTHPLPGLCCPRL